MTRFRGAMLSLLAGAMTVAVAATSDAPTAKPVPRLNLTLPPAELLAGLNLTLYGLTSSPPALATAPTSIAWARCAFTTSTAGVDRDDYDCATLAVPVCYADAAPCSLGNTRTHELRALRRLANATDAPTIWIVSESVDDASTAAMMERVASFSSGQVANVYAMQSRLWNPPTKEGSDVRTPCAKLAVDVGARLEIDSTTIDAAAACHAWLEATFGTNATNAFSLGSAARDLATALQIVHSASANQSMYVLAMGQGSRVVQRFITAHSKGITIAGYIFDTPHAMALPATHDEIAGASMGRFLDGCSSHVECSTKFANLSMSMRDVLSKMETAVELPDDQTSHCVRLLMSATFNEDRDLKPSHGVRRFFAALRRADVGYKVAAPLLYRLQRCNEGDHYGVEKLLGVRTTPSWSAREALVVFAERVVAFSELWPTPTLPSRAALASSFEKSLVSDGAMVAQQPSYCLYAASDAPECLALYKRNPQVNATLKFTYPRASVEAPVNASTGLVSAPMADVLILTSRLSVDGSDRVASDLYDAFVAAKRSAILVESDSATVASELQGPVSDTLNVMMQVVGAFVTKQAKPLHGKWRARDLSVARGGWSTAESTYASSPPVALSFTITDEERTRSMLLAERDMYEFTEHVYSRRTSMPSVSSDDSGGVQYGYYVMMVCGFLLLAVYMAWARAKRDDAELGQSQRARQPPIHVNVMLTAPQPAPQHVVYGLPPTPPPPPHAIPVLRPNDPQVVPPTAYATAPPSFAGSTQPPATQWHSERVNEYAYSYTPVADPYARTGP